MDKFLRVGANDREPTVLGRISIMNCAHFALVMCAHKNTPLSSIVPYVLTT